MKENHFMQKLFLAARLANNPTIEAYLAEYQRQFGFAKMRWIEPQHLHITLKFFGPTDNITAQKIIDVITETSRKLEPMNLTITKLNIFGSKHAAKVLWWGINEEALLTTTVQHLQTGFNTIGLYADRQNFVPHISLARIIDVKTQSFFQKQLSKYHLLEPIIPFNISSLLLMESKISRQGVAYSEIARFQL